MEKDKSKILVFGGTGYIGNHIVKASIKLGHPTFVFSRPNSDRIQTINELQSLGAIIVKGEIGDHDKLVSVLREVDVAISVLPYPQVFEQLKILEAIKVVGNIKRFVPSDFGVEEDRVAALPPFQTVLERKKEIRRAIEDANVPYTFVAANCCGAYFVNYLLHPAEQKEDVTVYGSGEAKAVLNYEEDVGILTIKVATDPRTCNRVVIYKPPANIISQVELIALWEKKSGRVLKRIHFTEEEMVSLSQSLPDPQNIPISIFHTIFVKGATTSFDLGEKEIEASALYPSLKLTTIDELLDIFLSNPPKPAYTPFE